MKNNKWFLVIASYVGVFLMGGCAASIQSIKATDFNAKIKDVYVVFDLPDGTEDLQKEFAGELQILLQERNVVARIEPPHGLSLENNDDYKDRINKKRSEGNVLVISGQVGGKHRGFFSRHSLVNSLGVSLSSPSQRSLIWKAVIDDEYYGGRTSMGAIVSKLIEDKIL